MTVTSEQRTIWGTDLDPEFEGHSEAEARARDRMLAARAFTAADVKEHRRFRDPNAEAAEVDRMLAFVERYERQRDPFDSAGLTDGGDHLEAIENQPASEDTATQEGGEDAAPDDGTEWAHNDARHGRRVSP